MEAALRQRHCMIPYLYTMNYRSYAENMPLIEPMYYEYPENAEAYEVKNQYFFGSQLMAAPVTTPRIKGLNVAKTKVWFPEGIWYDIYTGMRYDGGRMLEVYRDLSSIPVFAKAGGILVCADADELDARSVIKILMYYVSGYSRRLMVSLSYTRMTMNPADMWMADV